MTNDACFRRHGEDTTTHHIFLGDTEKTQSHIFLGHTGKTQSFITYLKTKGMGKMQPRIIKDTKGRQLHIMLLGYNSKDTIPHHMFMRKGTGKTQSHF